MSHVYRVLWACELNRKYRFEELRELTNLPTEQFRQALAFCGHYGWTRSADSYYWIGYLGVEKRHAVGI